MKIEIKNILLNILSEIAIESNNCAETVEQMNEIAMREYRRLFETQ